VGPLAFVALVPLVWAWRTDSVRRAAWHGLLFGLAYFGLLLEWSRYFGVIAIAPLVIGEAAFFALAGALVATFARRGYRSPWLVAAVWVVCEGLRARLPFGGFPWGELGVALHDVPLARAVASVGGVPLVSFFVVAVNALLVDAVTSARARRRAPVAMACGGLAAMLVVAGVVDVTRFDPRVTGHVRFALLQGNDQDRDLTAKEIASDYLMRKHLALAAQLHGHYDLIVFPESALERDPTGSADVRADLVRVGRAHGAVVLANAKVRAHDGGLLNANVVYDPDGHRQGIYAKQHLVPFGEYVPLRDELTFISELEQVPYDFEHGHHRVMFRVAGHRFGTVICFESAFAPLVRGYVRDGAQLIVVTTNNRSYRRSGLAAQHLALSQMRAAETARPVLHASVSGISGVIEPDGSVHDTSRLFVNTITRGTIATTTGETLYVRLGDWVLLLSALALVAVAALGAWRARRRPAVDSVGS